MHLVVCEPCRLVYAPLPKCASTTMIHLLMDLAGMPPRRNRDCPRRTMADIGRRASGTYELRLKEPEIADVVEHFRAYTWFSVVRNPFSRVESNYHNKLNRYAKRYHPVSYLLSYTTPVRPGISVEAWQAARIRRLQTAISFEQFVHGLARNGIDWDLHFQPQCSVLELDRVPYDHLIDMANLADGLSAMLRNTNRQAVVRAAIEGMRRFNASRPVDAHDVWTPGMRAIVEELYREDFEALDALAVRGRRLAA